MQQDDVGAMKASHHNFKDAGSTVVVTVDACSTDHDVQVQVTGDSLTVSAQRDGKPVVLLSVPQLYSTIDASSLDWEDVDRQVVVKLSKLDPSLRWPQLEANKQEAAHKSKENPLEDREHVKALLSAAQCGDVEAFKAAGRLFTAGQLDAVKDAHGRNALHFAAASSKAVLCSYLAQEESFDLDVTDESGTHAPMECHSTLY